MGLKKNFIYNLILTLSNYIVGLIVFPYISRVLGVSNVGIIGFVDNTINYFILFATMGVNMIGAREIAKVKINQSNLNQVFSSLITLSSFFVIFIYAIYFISIHIIPKFNEYNDLFLIGAAKIIFTVYSLDWFYKGIENFKYISIRNISIKFIYIISLFLFVQSKNDTKIYFILTISNIVLSSLVNIWYSRNFVKISFKNVTLKPYFKQTLYIGSYSILTSMYTTFNIMFLGFVTNPIEVGYYWTALKIYTIILGIYTAFTGVMMPRMSALLAKNDFEKFNILSLKSFELLFSFAFPLIICCVMFAPQIILILSGNGFEGAIIPMQIIMPLILIVGIAQILAIQILIPMKLDKSILIASIIGACVGILSNFLIVSEYGCVGTAIVLLISELIVTTYYVVYTYKKNILQFSQILWFKHLYVSIPYILINYFILYMFQDVVLIVIFAFILNGIYFILSQFLIIKNEFVIQLINTFKINFQHNFK